MINDTIAASNNSFLSIEYSDIKMFRPLPPKLNKSGPNIFKMILRQRSQDREDVIEEVRLELCDVLNND